MSLPTLQDKTTRMTERCRLFVLNGHIALLLVMRHTLILNLSHKNKPKQNVLVNQPCIHSEIGGDVKACRLVVRLLLFAYAVNLCISIIYIYRAHQFLESESAHQTRLLSMFTTALNNQNLPIKNMSMVTKSIAIELFTLGLDEVYYVNLTGEMKRLEPTRYDKVERLFRVSRQREVTEYIQNQLWLNAFLTMVIVVLAILVKKFRNEHHVRLKSSLNQ